MSKISKEILHGLGLTEAQGQVYVAALELGQATMQDLARKSNVKRTSIYNFIHELKESRLIVEVKKKKRTFYAATHPRAASWTSRRSLTRATNNITRASCNP